MFFNYESYSRHVHFGVICKIQYLNYVVPFLALTALALLVKKLKRESITP